MSLLNPVQILNVYVLFYLEHYLSDESISYCFNKENQAKNNEGEKNIKE